MKNCIRLLLLVTMSFISLTAVAQSNITITGVVKYTNGETVIGANVTIEGTTTGTITDINGNFTLNAPSDGELVVSYIGFQTQKISINKQHTFNITLKEDAEMLSEVVVTALGIKCEKKALGYAMQEIKNESFSENRSLSSVN